MIFQKSISFLKKLTERKLAPVLTLHSAVSLNLITEEEVLFILKERAIKDWQKEVEKNKKPKRR